MAKTIFIGARKGGTGKTTTVASLGVGLARAGKRTLVIDADSQRSLTISLGIREPEKLHFTLATAMTHIMGETGFDPAEGIIHHAEGVDLLPANKSLTGIDLMLAPLMGRELVLRQYIERISPLYDIILLDTGPTLDLLTLNALAAADSAIIPITPKYLDAMGLELLLKNIAQMQRQINPALKIDGILLTKVERRITHTQEVIDLINSAYGGNIRVFGEYIPRSVRAAETAAQGVSIFTHDPNGKVAAAYAALTREVLHYAA